MSPPVEYLPRFVKDPDEVLLTLRDQVLWDRRMRARLTASMGEPYNYSAVEPGSLLFMPGHMQAEWEHSLPPTVTQEARMSLTFRRLVSAQG